MLVRTRWLTGCLVLAIIGAAGSRAGPSQASSAAGSASRAQPARCAQKHVSERVEPNPWPRAHRQLAPSGAHAMRLCRYSGLNVSPRTRLVRSRLLTNPALVTELVGQFNQLPPFPPGVFACPADNGSQIVALLAYPNGNHVTIMFELTGCQTATNGDLVRVANGYGTHPGLGPHLLSELERLLTAHDRDR